MVDHLVPVPLPVSPITTPEIPVYWSLFNGLGRFDVQGMDVLPLLIPRMEYPDGFSGGLRRGDGNDNRSFILLREVKWRPGTETLGNIHSLVLRC